MAFDLTGTPENGLTEPEGDVDQTAGADEGELQDHLSFLFWWDDGDNVFEDDETVIEDLSGLPGSVFSGEWLAIADSNNGQALEGGTTHYVGKGWCFGEMTRTPAAQQANNDGPTPGNTGFECDGSGDHNAAQTDGIEVDVAFQAIQSRNNDTFLCSSLPPLEGDGGGDDENVGALLSAYVAPEVCNAVVGDAIGGQITHTSIQTAIDDASEDGLVCVDSTYAGDDTFPVNVDKTGLTIAGLGSAGDANIPGGFFIDASGVTVKGLEFTDFSFIASSEDAAIYIHNEAGQGSNVALTGTTIIYNIFTAPADAKSELAKGVVTEIGSGATPVATSIDVMHNVFGGDGWRQAMFFNTASGYEVAFNDIYGNDVGVANDGPHNGSIHNNDFEDNVLEAVGAAPSAENGTGNNGVLAVNMNNFAPGATDGNDVNWYGSSVLGGADVDATNNWWDGDIEADRTNDVTEVDTSSAEVSAFPEN